MCTKIHLFTRTHFQSLYFTHKEMTADLFVATELRWVEQGAVVEKLRDELSAAHASVAVWVGDHSGQSCHHQHLNDGVVTQTSGLTFPRDRLLAMHLKE